MIKELNNDWLYLNVDALKSINNCKLLYNEDRYIEGWYKLITCKQCATMYLSKTGLMEPL